MASLSYPLVYVNNLFSRLARSFTKMNEVLIEEVNPLVPNGRLTKAPSAKVVLEDLVKFNVLAFTAVWAPKLIMSCMRPPTLKKLFIIIPAIIAFFVLYARFLLYFKRWMIEKKHFYQHR